MIDFSVVDAALELQAGIPLMDYPGELHFSLSDIGLGVESETPFAGLDDELILTVADISLRVAVNAPLFDFLTVDLSVPDVDLEVEADPPNLLLFPAGFTVAEAVVTPQSPHARFSLGPLPAGLVLADNGDGTADLYGVPENGTEGEYEILLLISNGVAPDAQETLTIKVV